MHKLMRTAEPPALAQARADGLSNWDDFNNQDKKTVRDELLLMQDFRCAYCERQIHALRTEDKWEGHIEQFRRKDQHFLPELTFVWDNLFYSCRTGATCGRFKDGFITKKEQYDWLIDPCKENPEDFLIFDDQGRISPRTDLTESDKKRAEFTIKTFNLNEPELMLARKRLQKKYDWLKQCSQQEINAYLNSSVKKEPFITAIYQYFGKRVVS